VDLELCEGSERCATAASGPFQVPDDQAHLLMENPPTAWMEKVKLAIRRCPRPAISLSEIEFVD